MELFPKELQIISPSSNKLQGELYQSVSLNGFLVEQKKFSSLAMAFNITILAKGIEQKNMLENFYLNNFGKNFRFFYPLDKKEYVVQFINTTLEYEQFGTNCFTYKIELRSVSL